MSMPGQLSTWIADRLLLTLQKGARSNQFRPLFSPLLAENKPTSCICSKL